ncbi:MAG: FKBP-type peptidyl-prolyl cis-trans isomerase [Lachnospiraceae bacterium]|nr:FKBP-type peptidyl-prolyl cis-trans isomerase [Lachnospiraceae bacterium]
MSQKKRLIEQKKKKEALKKAQRRQTMIRIAGIAVAIAVVGIIVGALVFDFNKSAEKDLNYSIGLDDNGLIKNVKASKHVKLADLDAINKNAKDYYPSADEEESYINAIVDSYPELFTNKGVEVKEEDIVSLDFVGKVDGKEYEGGSTNGNGTRVTLGAGDLPDGFDEQIIGHKTGETFEISVDYPEEFGNEELAGKTADYEITINGIYLPAEFNDDFVKRNFGSNVANCEEFLEEYRRNYAETAFDNYLKEYVVQESEIKSYPASYLSKVKKFMKAKDYKQYETTNATYQNLYGFNAYDDVYTMRGMSKSEYRQYIREAAGTEAKKNLVMQALYEQYGLNITDEKVKEVTASFGLSSDSQSDVVDRFGENYLKQQTVIKVVNDYLAENFNLDD